jgi:hypothetical protein
MLSDITGWGFLVMLVASSVGAGFFIYGLKQRDAPTLLLGTVLSIYPFFIHAAWASALIGVGLIGLFILFRRYR